MRDDETGLVTCSWKRSAWRLPVNRHFHAQGRYGKGRYYTAANALVQRILDSGALVLMAREESDPGYVYGWIATGLVGDVHAIYYAFTKEHFRELGVMHALKDRVLEIVPGDLRRVYCERSPFDAVFRRWGFTYVPVDEVLGEQRRSA